MTNNYHVTSSQPMRAQLKVKNSRQDQGHRNAAVRTRQTDQDESTYLYPRAGLNIPPFNIAHGIIYHD